MAIERGNRLAKVVAAAMGAEVDMSSKYDQYFEKEEEVVNPALYDPAKGGRIPDAEDGEYIESLPINLGYSIMNSE